MQPHTHPESSFLAKVGNSVRRCLTATGECLEPERKEKEQREREEKLRRDEQFNKEDRDYLDEYDRKYWARYREEQRQKAIKMEELKMADIAAKRNLESAKEERDRVDRDEASRINAGWRELLRVRLQLEDATKAAKAAAAKVVAAEAAEREKYGYQGGRKTKKIKHRHHKKSLRHRKKSLRHHKKSLRHRKKSMKHRKKY